MMMLFRLIGKHSTRNKTQCKYVMSTLFKNLLFAKLGSCQVVYKISRNVIKGFLLFCHDVLQKIRCTDGTTKIKNLKRRKTKNTWNQGSRFRSLWLYNCWALLLLCAGLSKLNSCSAVYLFPTEDKYKENNRFATLLTLQIYTLHFFCSRFRLSANM
jgi:hypothetical protein